MLEISIKDGKIYSYIRDKWLVCTPEEEVRQGFIHTLINKFGYQADQIAEEVQVNNSKRVKNDHLFEENEIIKKMKTSLDSF